MKDDRFFSTISEADRAKYDDVPLERLPPEMLVGMFKELTGAYVAMSTVADVLRNFIEAAADRLDEGKYDKAAQTIRRAAVLLADAEAPQKQGRA